MFYNYIKNDLDIYYKTIHNCKIREILNYSLEGGKCIRGFIVKHIIETLTCKPTTIWQPVVCVELVHALSLIVDDLPCMDNDIIRRHKPSTFIKFGERSALLSTFYGMSHALHILFDGLDSLNMSNENYIYFIKELINKWHELIGTKLVVGQMMDLKENIKELVNDNTIPTTINIIIYKTCSLFMFAFILGRLYSGIDLSLSINLEDYKSMGYYFGLMFQIMDDSNDIKTDDKDINIILNLGSKESYLLYLESKLKLLNLLEKNLLLTSEFVKMINKIDDMLKLG
jgi:geranylgeranyl diphosphate synthase type II